MWSRFGLIGAFWFWLWGAGVLTAGLVWNVAPWGHSSLPTWLDVLLRVLVPLTGVALLVGAVLVTVARVALLGRGAVLLARGGRDATEQAAAWRPGDLRNGVDETIYATQALRKKGL